MNERLLEILVITQEEAGEVIQEIAKCFRFGIDGVHKSGIPHREMLEQEIGDFLAMVKLLEDEGVVTREGLADAVMRKTEKLHHWSSIFVQDAQDEQDEID